MNNHTVKKMLYKNSLLFFVLTFSLIGKAQETWDLTQCFQTGIQNNITIQSNTLDIETAKQERVARIGSFLPSFSLNGTHEYNFGSVIDQNTNSRASLDQQTNQMYVSSSVSLFNWGNVKQLEKAKIAYQKALTDVEAVKFQTKQTILQAYFQILYIKDFLDVSKKQVEYSTHELKRVGTAIEAGSKSKSDLYDAQVNLAKDQQVVLDTENRYNLAKLQLIHLLNLQDRLTPDQFEIKEIQSEKLYSSDPNLNQTVTDNNPEILSLRKELESSVNDIKIAKSNYLPTADLLYQYHTFYSKVLHDDAVISPDFNDQFSDNASQYLGLRLSLPVFNQLQTKTMVHKNQIAAEKAQLAIENKKNELIQMIQTIQLERENAHKKYLLAQETLEASQKSFSTTQKKYEIGQVNAFDLYTSKNNLSTIEYEAIRAHYEYLYKLFELDLYLNP